MTPLEALKEVKEAAERLLQDHGIEHNWSPSFRAQDPAMREKYARPDRLPPEEWGTMTFFLDRPSCGEHIHGEKLRLNARGIHFDSGGGLGARDWEIDWSFHVDE